MPLGVLKQFRNLSKTLEGVPDAALSFAKLYGDKPNTREYFKTLDEGIGLYQGDAALDPIKRGGIAGLKGGLDAIHSKNVKGQLSGGFNDFFSALPEGEKLGGLSGKFIDEKIQNISLSTSEIYGSIFARTEANVLKQGGERGLKIFRDYLEDPISAFKVHGVSEIEIFRALKNPDLVEDVALKGLGAAYKDTDKNFIKTAQALGQIGELENFVAPLSPNPIVVQTLGVDGLANLIETYSTNFSKEQARSTAKSIYNQVLDKKGKNVSLSFGSREIQFGSVDDEFNYFKAISSIGEADDSLLGAIFRHKENTINKLYLQKDFGIDPQKTINEFFADVLQEAKAKNDPKLLEDILDAQKLVSKTLDLAIGGKAADSDTLQYFSSAIEKAVSGTYGVIQSSPRNVGIDYTAHGASFNKALLTDESVPGYLSNRVFSVSKGFIASLAKNKEHRAGVNSILDIFEFANSSSSLINQTGVAGALTQNALTNPLKQGALKKVGKYLDVKAGKLQGKLNQYAGNALHYDLTTTLNLFKVSGGFTRILDNSKNYRHFVDNVGGGLAEGYLKTGFGIGEKEFEALKQVQKHLFKRNSLQKSLGFSDDVSVLVPADILKLSDEAANKFRNTGESVSQFRQRLHKSYHSYLASQRNLSQTKLTRTSRFTDRGLERGTHIDLILRFFAPFANIAEKQWENLRKGLSLAHFGDPYRTSLGGVASGGRGLYARYGKAAVFYTSGALAVGFAKDALNGKTPRNLDSDQMLKYFASSGFGGVAMSVLAAGLYSTRPGFYGSTPLGDLLNTSSGIIDQEGINGYKLSKAVQRATGVGKLWYTQGIVDHFLREAILSETEIDKIENWYETNLGQSFYAR